MFKKLAIVFLVFSLFCTITCSFDTDRRDPFVPRYIPVFAHDLIESGPSIEILDVSYLQGANTTEDRTKITFAGYGWDSCDRIRVYYNGFRIKTFDIRSTDWTYVIIVASVQDNCTVQVEGTVSGWSNKCEFYGALPPPSFTLLEMPSQVGTVGSEVAIVAQNWTPRGLVEVYFRGMPVAKLFPDAAWVCDFTIPEAPCGVWPVTVRDESVVQKFDYQVIPALMIDPEEAVPGQRVAIVGSGFAPNCYVHLTPFVHPYDLAFTNSNGSFRIEDLEAPSDSCMITALDYDENSAEYTFTPKAPAVVTGNDESNTAPATSDYVTVESNTAPTQGTGTLSPQVIAICALGGIVLLIVVAVVLGILLRRNKKQLTEVRRQIGQS
jgi:hypothetical protein